jgi:hypothetical protein
MSISGWLEAWPGIVSLGWVLVLLAMVSFAAGAVSVSWWKDRPWRREQARARREHHRQYLARKQREKERDAGDRRLLEDVAWQWPDVLAHVRLTSTDGVWFTIKGTRPLRVEAGTTLIVEADGGLPGPLMRLRALILAHAIAVVTGHTLDVEWQSATVDA